MAAVGIDFDREEKPIIEKVRKLNFEMRFFKKSTTQKESFYKLEKGLVLKYLV